MPDAICSVDGCEKPPKKRSRMCSMHATRLARHGDVNVVRPNAAGRFVQHGGGYIKLTGSTHPLADGGTVYEHRAVLFDAIGAGDHACRWCGCSVHWWPSEGQTQLVVDHLDANRQNNDPANLVPACQTCNAGRTQPYKLAWTHCPNGHEYTPENQVANVTAHRKCLICRREAVRRYDTKKRRALGVQPRRFAR